MRGFKVKRIMLHILQYAQLILVNGVPEILKSKVIWSITIIQLRWGMYVCLFFFSSIQTTLKTIVSSLDLCCDGAWGGAGRGRV